ncbi:hypothetical protein KEM56_004344 [Ascosphaera pollenicola]|nr:hypothetical protein KEM56_004344 [Ascosphaera pollenicola]
MRSDTEENYENPYILRQSWEPTFFRLQDREEGISEGSIKQTLCDIESNGPHVFQLDAFDQTLEPIDSEEPSLPSSGPDSETSGLDNLNENVQEDVWLLSEIPDLISGRKPLKTWDNFAKRLVKDSGPLYLSEAGNEGYDAFLAYRTGYSASGRLAPSALFISCLCLTQIGCNSIFFRFDDKSNKFVRLVDDVRISGVSLPAITSLIDDVLLCGTRMRQIERFVESTSIDVNRPVPIFGLARASFLLHGSIRQQLSEVYLQEPSLLKLTVLSRRLVCFLDPITSIIDSCRESASDGEMITAIFRECTLHANQSTWLSGILHQIITLVTLNWLSLVESWIGLRPYPCTVIELNRNGKGFVRASCTLGTDAKKPHGVLVEFDYHPEAMPEFLPMEYRDQIFESGKNLRMLKTCHPHHPLVLQSGPAAHANLHLEITLDWEDIERIQDKASQYEKELRSEILKYYQETGSVTSGDIGTADEVDVNVIEEPNMATDAFDLFDIDCADASANGLPMHQALLSSRIYSCIKESKFLDLEAPLEAGNIFGPPLSSSIYYSFAPVISAQTRMITYSCLELLFQGHHIRTHLDTQWRFQLMCDGVFSSRLSMILFDSEMHSGERKRGVATAGVSTGLRLGSRDTWPPATSELRLVLMGLLSECYHGSGKQAGLRKGTQGDDKDLPGGLSFAIRQLSGDDLRKFKDPNSVEALDFLRLLYTPPPVLETVFTPKALDSYDLIFKHLLQLTRLLAVVRNLARHSAAQQNSCNEWTTKLHLFRMEALHFVESLAEYIFQVGIGRAWQRWDNALEKIETGTATGDIDQTLAYARSLRHLREHHEDVLYQIRFALFLTKRHAQANKLLEDIFGTILLFAPVSKTLANATDDDDLDFSALGKRVSQLHIIFKKQTHEFLQFLRDLSGDRGGISSGRRSDFASWGSDQKNTCTATIFDHLLLRLDFKRYY